MTPDDATSLAARARANAPEGLTGADLAEWLDDEMATLAAELRAQNAPPLEEDGR